MNDKTAKLPDDMSVEELHEHYSEMLATANDLGFRVPDELLVESDDAEILRGVCAKLDDGITAFRAGLDVGDDKSDEGMPAPEKPKVTRVGKKPAAKKTTKKSATKPTDSSSRPSAGTKKPVAKGAKPVVKAESTESTAKPKDSPEAPSKLSKSEESTMAKTAKKTAKKAPAKAPAKKAAAKTAKSAKSAKAPAKKSAGRPASSRTYKEDAKITVKVDENPCRAGTGRFERVANILKHDGKTVGAYLKSGGKAGSLRYSEEQGWIKVA